MKILIFTILIFTLNTLHAQTSEVFSVVAERDLFIPGERVNYSVFINDTVDKDNHLKSKICYIQLIDSDSKSIIKQIISLKNDAGVSSFILPNSLKSNNYCIIAYSKQMLNSQELKPAFKIITVVNPQQKFLVTQSTIIDTGRLETNKPLLEFSTLLDKSSFKCRDTVSLNINLLTSSNKANIIIKVTKKGTQYINNTKSISFKWHRNGLTHNLPNNFYYPKETHGLIISGYVKTDEDVDIYASILGNVSNFNYTTTDNGLFYLLMNRCTGSKQVLFYSSNQNSGQINIASPWDVKPVVINMPELNYTLLDTAVLNSLLIAHKVNLAYNTTEKIVLKNDEKPFYFDTDEELFIDEFIKLPVLEEVFRELVKGVLVVGTGSNKTFKVVGKHTNRTLGDNPCILLNGIPEFNRKKLFELPPQKIKTIAVVQSPYLYKGTVWDGIIDITLKKPDITYNNLPDNHIVNAIAFPEYVSEVNLMQDCLQTNIPDYRNTLYFNPNIIIDNQKATVSFQTSDEKGGYIVTVIYIDNKGVEHCTSKQIIVE